MKNAILVSAMLLIGASGAAHADSTGAPESRYPSAAIGYDSLMAGDNLKAIDDILNGSVSRHDPAVLLNLGQAYARAGRFTEARAMFRKAAKKSEDVELVLANGTIIGSKQAARQALATVEVGLASR